MLSHPILGQLYSLPHVCIRDIALLACCNVALQFTSILQAQTFTDVTVSAGIKHVHWPDYDPIGPFPGHQLVSAAKKMSGGAAAGDFNGDGWVDLFFSRMDAADVLYLNQRDGTFQDASSVAGFTEATPSNGAAAGDIDNDGDLDLYVTSVHSSQFYLYTNDGSGVFSEQAVSRGADVQVDPDKSETRQGMSVALGDYDRDGFLDIHTSEWTGRRLNRSGEVPLTHTSSRLLRNVGVENPGYFQDQTSAAGVALGTNEAFGPRRDIMPGVWSFASGFHDMDGDGWQDLVVAGDFHSSKLFWNNGNGTFTDGTTEANVGTDENGMGSAVGDYDGDGDLDWFVTSIFDPEQSCERKSCNWGYTGNRLYRNEGDRIFSDQTDEASVRRGGWGWGTAWLDYDNDRDLDLVMTNGFENSTREFFSEDPVRLWKNDGSGHFQEVAHVEGLTHTGLGRGLLTMDYDRDGDQDLLIINNIDQPVLYRNETNSVNTDAPNGWLQVQTIGTISNRDGIGTLITLDPDDTVDKDTITRHVDGGSHFLAQSELTVHIGLGDFDSTVDLLHVQWPNGAEQFLYDVEANQRITIVEPIPEPPSHTIALQVIASGLLWLKRRRGI